jgi:hypothetical protein
MRATVFFSWLFFSMPVFSAGADVLPNEEAVVALKQLLLQAAGTAADKLGVTNGFLENPKVKIALPGTLQKAGKLMRKLGGGKYADGLVVAMNRAAESAAMEAKPVLVDTVKNMSLEDAGNILAAGDDAGTRYFRSHTSEALAQKFLPIVKNATHQVGLAKKYNEFAGKGAKFGVVAEEDANIEKYVTQKMLDGLFIMMAEEESRIRNEPLHQGSTLLQNLF